MIRLYPFLLAVLLAVPAGAQTAAPPDAPVDLTDALFLADVWLDAQQDFDDLPGVAVAVVRGDSTVWASAYGHADVEAGVPFTPQTQVHIASISKTFAAVAVMTLVDAGTLRLDDRVEDVLPWFRPPPRAQDNGPITVRRLLTHSAGLTREIDARIWDGFTSTPRGDRLRAELVAETLYPTETVFQYSNLGFMLIGELVAHVTGMPYTEYLRQTVLGPLGLDATGAGYPASAYGAAHAVGYTARQRDQAYRPVAYDPPEQIASMGGLSSNVLDLATYAAWQLRLHDEDAEAEVLRPSTLRSMHRVHFTDADWETTWGLGFGVAKAPDASTTVGHGGHAPGFKTDFLLHPSNEMAYVATVTTSGANASTYTRGLMALVSKAKRVPPDAENRLDRARLAEYAGRYLMLGIESAIVPWEGRLAVVRLPTDDPAEAMTLLEHVEGDMFRRVRDDERPGETTTFTRAPDGRVVSARTYNYVRERVDV